MNLVRKLLSHRRLLIFLGVVALLFGLMMAHPLPRQALFGPTVRGKPRYSWEMEIRRHVENPGWIENTLEWLGIERQRLSVEELFNDPEMLPLVRDMLDDRDRAIQRAAMVQIYSFEVLQDESMLPGLYRRFESDDLDVQLFAGRVIWTMKKDKKVLTPFLELLDSPIAGQRSLGVTHLADFAADAPELYPKLVAHAKDTNPRVRGPLMHAMQHFGRKGLPIMLAGLKDTDAEVRCAAAIALGSVGPIDPAVLPALEACLNDDDPDVRLTAIDSLRSIDPERYKHLQGGRK